MYVPHLCDMLLLSQPQILLSCPVQLLGSLPPPQLRQPNQASNLSTQLGSPFIYVLGPRFVWSVLQKEFPPSNIFMGAELNCRLAVSLRYNSRLLLKYRSCSIIPYARYRWHYALPIHLVPYMGDVLTETRVLHHCSGPLEFLTDIDMLVDPCNCIQLASRRLSG
jgi:hypothetical protein